MTMIPSAGGCGRDGRSSRRPTSVFPTTGVHRSDETLPRGRCLVADAGNDTERSKTTAIRRAGTVVIGACVY